MIVGWTNGCFDILHVGHIRILRESKKLCDVLHVGINSDKSVSKLKGIYRPIIPEDQRVEIIKSIKYVDHVHLFDEETPLKLIETIMPDIIVKGMDYKKENVVGAHLAEVITIPLVSVTSTTEIINKIMLSNK